MKLSKLLILLIIVTMFPLTALNIYAQSSPSPVQCGQIVEGEFLREGDEGMQEYGINLAPGDRLSLSGETVGDYLAFGILVYSPTNKLVGETGGTDVLGRVYYSPSMETSALSERGNYKIGLRSDGPGLYTLYIGCTLRDGTVIAPGDVLPDTQPTEPATVTTELPSDFVGFPGLTPVDMSNAVKLPLLLDTPMTGVVAPTSSDVLGFSVEVNTGDTLDLSFNRVSGNLNLGVVVLSPDSKVVFYGGLILSDSLSTSLTIQNTGEYTIGVYRVDLLQPDILEATVFQVQGAIVP